MTDSETGRIITQLVDNIARHQPETLFCIHPNSQERGAGWFHVSYKMFACAVDRLAWWIDSKVDGQGQTLAYMGTNDLRYAAFILACMKTGHAAMLLSTRNSPSAFRHLISVTNCSILVDGSERTQLCEKIKQVEKDCSDLRLQRWTMSPMWEVFSLARVQHFPHQVKFSEVEDQIAIIIHSSGTTGLPKPVPLKYGYLAGLDNMQNVPVPPGRQRAQRAFYNRGQLRLWHGPLFHIMGVMAITESVFFETPFLLCQDRPLTTEVFTQIMEMETPPKWGLLAPFVLQEISASEKGRQALGHLSSLNYAGAPMAPTTGQNLSSVLQLQAIFGSSETGLTPTLLCEDPIDWDYMEWNPSLDLSMEEAGDGLYELVLLRPASRKHYPVFYTYPDLTEYRTGDLFRPHPSKPKLWQYQGRGDDIIVLSNGEKFNPIDAEKLIESDSLVNNAAVFGKGRFQAALIIEPRWEALPTGWTPSSLLSSLKPLIDQANALLPAHGQILQSHVALSCREKPFDLSPKGSLRRKDIEKTYKDLLDEVYQSKLQEHRPNFAPKNSTSCSFEEIQRWLQGAVAEILTQETVGLNESLISYGIDSLQVVRLSQIMESSSRGMDSSQKHRGWNSATIYELDTVQNLARAFWQQVTGNTEPKINLWTREDRLTHSIWNHARFLGNGGLRVALTGSTGELGSYLLHELLQNPNIDKIYCLNRSGDAAAHQLASLQKKQLSSAIWLSQTDRVNFYHVNLEEEKLGISLETYAILQGKVDVFLHNAWAVNFNQPLAAFEPQLFGVQHLLNLVENSPRKPQFHFISSIATIAGQQAAHGAPVHEKLHDSSFVLQQGYAESKHVAEALCSISADRQKTAILIHRVGQLAGPIKHTAGMWNPRDWFPSLVKSSLAIKKLPGSLGNWQVDWVPIDTAAEAIVQVIQDRNRSPVSGLEVFHITHPHPTDWMSLAPVVADACAAKIVSLEDWVQALEKEAYDADNNDEKLQTIPAVQLLGFFRALVEKQDHAPPVIDTGNARGRSQAMRELLPLNESAMDLWLKQWKSWLPELRVQT